MEQREIINQSAADRSSENVKPPEVRIGQLSNSGQIVVEFTNEMQFPDNLVELINGSQKS